MKLTDRERSVLLVVPLVAVFCAYAWWFSLFHRPKLAAAQRELADAQAKEVKREDLWKQEAETNGLQREVRDREAEKAELERRIAALGRHPADRGRRIEPLRELTDLFRRHRLELIDEGPLAAGENAKLPSTLADALGRLDASKTPGAGGQPVTSGQMRSYKLSGRFVDLLRAVQELAADETPPGIPISLTMAEVDPTSQSRTWTLLVWM